MPPTSVLLIRGDEPTTELVRSVVACNRNCVFESSKEPADAVARVGEGGIGLALMCIRGPKDELLAKNFLRQIAAGRHALPTLVLSGQKDAELSLRLLRAGAVDCLSKPIDATRLGMLIELLTVRACYAQPEPIRAGYAIADHGETQQATHIMASPSAVHLMDQIRLLAPLDSTVLLTGETGTGKTSLARTIHALSPRRERPFMVVNCGALSPTLIESEMFGHARGAFTGADRNHSGKLADCADGTLLLDEIDSLPLSLQAKLLRAVEERVFEPVGSNDTLPMRARLVAATNRSLETEVEHGRFRADLYFRLNVLDLRVPPLRERREAIGPLVDQLLVEFNSSLGRQVQGLSSEAMDALLAYDWPGNIRELRNVMERAVALSRRTVIGLDGLSKNVQMAAHRSIAGKIPATGNNRLAQARHGAETQQLAHALARNNNNRSHAAADLGISRVTLYKKLRKYGLA